MDCKGCAMPPLTADTNFTICAAASRIYTVFPYTFNVLYSLVSNS